MQTRWYGRARKTDVLSISEADLLGFPLWTYLLLLSHKILLHKEQRKKQSTMKSSIFLDNGNTHCLFASFVILSHILLIRGPPCLSALSL